MSEARRTKTAERAAERVKEKLQVRMCVVGSTLPWQLATSGLTQCLHGVQVAYREVECSKLRVSAVEQAKDAALEQALAARTEASAVGASKQVLNPANRNCAQAEHVGAPSDGVGRAAHGLPSQRCSHGYRS